MGEVLLLGPVSNKYLKRSGITVQTQRKIHCKTNISLDNINHLFMYMSAFMPVTYCSELLKLCMLILNYECDVSNFVLLSQDFFDYLGYYKGSTCIFSLFLLLLLF